MRSIQDLLTMWVNFKEERGASMVEYALLVVLIAIIAIVAIGLVGGEVSEAFQTVANTLSSANN